jgi:hypothetical protein
MKSPFFPDDLRYREQWAEQRALDLMRYITYKECLEAYHLATEIVIEQLGKKTFTIQGGALFDRRTVRKFLTSINHPTDIYQLTDVEGQLASEYKRWILTEYTPRYRSITAQADLEWIEQVAVLAIRRYILESKYEAFVREGLSSFADPSVAVVMTMLMAYHTWKKEMPRLIYHIKGNSEQSQELIQQFFDEYERLFRNSQSLLPASQPPHPLLLGEREERQGLDG